MADPNRNGVNGAMSEQKESSVLFSLKELMNLEETRIKEEADAKKRKVDSELQAKLDVERRAREDEEARLRDEEERRRQDELRRKMEEAQVEAAKASEIEKRRLEDQHRLQMEALAKQQEHERKLQEIQSKKRKGVHPGILAAIAVLLLGAIGAVVFFVVVKPKQDAEEALKTADTALSADKEECLAKNGDECEKWKEADKNIGLAEKSDPKNEKIAEAKTKLAKLRDTRNTRVAAEEKARKDEISKTNAEMDKLKAALADSSKLTASQKEALEIQLKELAAKAGGGARPTGPVGGGGGAKPAGPKPPCVCPPGVPLCSC